MTGQEMCEAIVRHREPGLPDNEVARRARQFWNLSRSGGLGHVIDAYLEMRGERIAAGLEPEDPIPQSPVVGELIFRMAAGGAEELFFDGNTWRLSAFFPAKQDVCEPQYNAGRVKP